MLAEAECRNPQCPGAEWEDDGDNLTFRGHIFLVSEIPASRQDPGYIEGTCPKCGEEVFEWERLTDWDIELMKHQHDPRI